MSNRKYRMIYSTNVTSCKNMSFLHPVLKTHHFCYENTPGADCAKLRSFDQTHTNATFSSVIDLWESIFLLKTNTY